MTVGTILAYGGCMLSSVGICIALFHAVTAHPRNARPVRMDAECPPRATRRGPEAGIMLACVGAAFLLAAAYQGA